MGLSHKGDTAAQKPRIDQFVSDGENTTESFFSYFEKLYELHTEFVLCGRERERKRKEKQKKFKELCVGHRSETNSQVGSRTATENRLCFGTRTESRESWGKKTNCTHCVASQRQTVSLGSKLPSIVPTFPNSFSTLYYAINCTFLRYVNKYSMLFISTLLYLLNSTWLHELFVPV